MKIGILTFHYAINPGAFFQAKSLLDTLRDFGFDAEIIDYRPNIAYRAQLRMLLCRKNPFIAWGNFMKILRYSREIKEIISGKRIRTADDLRSSKYDVVVFGSDIIWAVPNILFEFDSAYFGEGMGNTRKVSYAASCGPYPPDLKMNGNLKNLLTAFDRIAVRDRLTQEWVLEAAAISSDLVLDPTLLREWPKGSYSNDKMIVYGYPFESDEAREIKKLAGRLDCSLRSIHFYNAWCEEQRNSLGPYGWLEGLQRAKYVVTNTFHGTLLSILLRKEFVTISRGLIGSKLDPVLKNLGLANRMITNPSEIFSAFSSEIDYRMVEERLDVLRRESSEYLFRAVSSSERRIG